MTKEEASGTPRSLTRIYATSSSDSPLISLTNLPPLYPRCPRRVPQHYSQHQQCYHPSVVPVTVPAPPAATEMSFINEPSSPPPLIYYVVVAVPQQQDDDDEIDEVDGSYEPHDQTLGREGYPLPPVTITTAPTAPAVLQSPPATESSCFPLIVNAPQQQQHHLFLSHSFSSSSSSSSSKLPSSSLPPPSSPLDSNQPTPSPSRVHTLSPFTLMPAPTAAIIVSSKPTWGNCNNDDKNNEEVGAVVEELRTF
jgi:hypothetical protein